MTVTLEVLAARIEALKEADAHLRDVLNLQLTSLDEQIKDSVKRSDTRARDTAEEVARRLEALNELRQDYDRQRNLFLVAAAHEVTHRALEEKIDLRFKPLEMAQHVTEGKASQRALILTAIVGLGGFIMGLIQLALKLAGS